MREGIYIYCIIRSGEPQTFGPIGIGDNGDEVYTLSFRDLGAVVSKAAVRKYTVARENLIPHERAIEEVMKSCTVLPVRFATIAADEDKVRRILEKEYDRFIEMLDHMEGKKELGLKALFKDDLIYKDILEKYEDIKTLRDKALGQPPEKTHYQRMEVGRMVEAALERERDIHREDMLHALSPLALEVKTNKTYGEQMILNAAFLVDGKMERAFDEKVQELADKYGEKVRFKYVGLLPPFNFVNLVIMTDEY
jgi:hypothetical protein